MQCASRIKEKEPCPVCGSLTVLKFLEIREVPLFCNVLLNSREEALNVPKGAIEMVFCQKCGHVYNRSFDPQRMHYSPAYENALHYSPRFQSYVEKLADRLTGLYRLANKRIIEIGCGKGDFLQLLAHKGNNCCIGFDPSYEIGKAKNKNTDNQVTIIQDHFSEKYTDLKADMVICRQVLEHIDNPIRFLEMIRNSIHNPSDAIFFFEVPNALFILKDLGVWDLIYEHRSYFTPQSLYTGLENAGFQPLNLRETFGGQYLCIENSAWVGAKFEDSFDNLPSIAEIERFIVAFSNQYENKKCDWRQFLDEHRALGKKVVVWGAGSKGITFMNVMQYMDVMPYAVDVNPRKQGKYCPGTAQLVVSPEALKDLRPDTVIIMNPIYAEEIKASLRAIRNPSEIVSIMSNPN
jgi:2-polyprenyl-3-methyl-5-hydroxy-6-metoxy-1,4-benzoquinol methylase